MIIHDNKEIIYLENQKKIEDWIIRFPITPQSIYTREEKLSRFQFSKVRVRGGVRQAQILAQYCRWIVQVITHAGYGRCCEW